MGEVKIGAGKIGKMYLGDKMILGGEVKEYIICAIDYYSTLGNNYLGIIDDTNNLVGIYNYKYPIDTDHTLLFYDRLSNILYGIEDTTKIVNISFNKVIYNKDVNVNIHPQNVICWYDKLIISEYNDTTSRIYIKQIDSVLESNEYLIKEDTGGCDLTQGFIFNNKAIINNYSLGFFAYDKYTNVEINISNYWHVEISDPVFVNDDCYLYANQEEVIVKIDKNFNVTEYGLSSVASSLSYNATHLTYINGKFIIYAKGEYLISANLINWEKHTISGSNIASSTNIKYRNVNRKVFAYYLQNGVVYTAFSSDGVTFDFEEKIYTLPNNLGTTKMYVQGLNEDCMTVVNDNFLKAITN